jgi:hypothetical protein
VSPRAERIVHNVSQACDAPPGRINTSGDRRPRVRYAQRPRRTPCSHDCQRAPRKLSVPPTILPRRYAPAASAQLPYLKLSGCQLLSQGRPGVRLARHQRCRQALRRQHGNSGVGRHCDENDAQPTSTASAVSATTATAARHQRRRQALRRLRCTARRIGGCNKHCEYNDSRPGNFSHGRRDRDVRYARTIVNAHYVS